MEHLWRLSRVPWGAGTLRRGSRAYQREALPKGLELARLALYRREALPKGLELARLALQRRGEEAVACGGQAASWADVLDCSAAVSLWLREGCAKVRTARGSKGLVGGTSRAHAQLLRASGYIPPLVDLQGARVAVLGFGDNMPLLMASALGVLRAGGCLAIPDPDCAGSEGELRQALDKLRAEAVLHPAACRGEWLGWVGANRAIASVAVPDSPLLCAPSRGGTPHLYLPPKDYAAPPPPPGVCAARAPPPENVGEAPELSSTREAVCVEEADKGGALSLFSHDEIVSMGAQVCELLGVERDQRLVAPILPGLEVEQAVLCMSVALQARCSLEFQRPSAPSSGAEEALDPKERGRKMLVHIRLSDIDNIFSKLKENSDL